MTTHFALYAKAHGIHIRHTSAGRMAQIVDGQRLWGMVIPDSDPPPTQWDEVLAALKATAPSDRPVYHPPTTDKAR